MTDIEKKFAISVREFAYKCVDDMTEQQMLEFIRDQIGLDDIPNQETLEALEELQYMKEHPEEYKSYKSVDEMFKDILGDEWDPDYTKATPSERERIEHAESSGFIADEDVDWDHLEKYAE